MLIPSHPAAAGSTEACCRTASPPRRSRPQQGWRGRSRGRPSWSSPCRGARSAQRRAERRCVRACMCRVHACVFFNASCSGALPLLTWCVRCHRCCCRYLPLSPLRPQARKAAAAAPSAQSPLSQSPQSRESAAGLEESSYRNLPEARVALAVLYALLSAGACCQTACAAVLCDVCSVVCRACVL